MIFSLSIFIVICILFVLLIRLIFPVLEKFPFERFSHHIYHCKFKKKSEAPQQGHPKWITSNKKSPKNFPTFLRRKTNFLFPCKTKIEKIAKKIFLHIKPINLYSILHHWLRDFHWKIVSRIVFSNWFVKKKWKEKYYTQHIFSLIKLFLCFSLS